MPNETPAVEVQIADAIVRELNDGARSWAGQFVAKRSWLVIHQGDDLTGLRVAVVPPELEQRRIARKKHQRDYGHAISIQKRVDARADATNEPDEVTKIAEDILNFYSDAHELASLAGYTVIDAQRGQIYDLDQMYEHSHFVTLIALTIRGYRDHS